jgi:hypothetical protein
VNPPDLRLLAEQVGFRPGGGMAEETEHVGQGKTPAAQLVPGQHPLAASRSR